MKCGACDSNLPVQPTYRTTTPDKLQVFRHYRCRRCGMYTRIPSPVVAQATEHLNTVPLAVLVRRKTQDDVHQEGEYRRGHRDGVGYVICAMQELIDEHNMTVREAFQLLWDYWKHDLANWQHSRPGEVVEPPPIPVPVSSARSW